MIEREIIAIVGFVLLAITGLLMVWLSDRRLAKERGDFLARLDRISDEENSALKQETIDALEHIAEYWNQDRNETAMADALEHITNVAKEVLAKERGDRDA